MIGLIDYGMGNLRSVANALDWLGAEVTLCRRPEEITDCERLILPGVGAVRDCMQQLHQRELIQALEQAARVQKRPLLGICLGMQVLARHSSEGGQHAGLGWFEAKVVRLAPPAPLRVPHVGWNNLLPAQEHPLLKDLPASPDVYFVHSYQVVCDHEQDVLARCDYGSPFVAAMARDNLAAVQFHPEKSQDFGLKLLENFLDWEPVCSSAA